MPHARSYPVTEVSLPQPHVDFGTTFVKKPGDRMSCSGWLPCVMAGILAIVFMVCIFTFGGRTLFLVGISSPSVLVPLVKQGDLRAYPFHPAAQNGVQSLYHSQLPPTNVTEFALSLQTLLEEYPKDHGTIYKNCWLENPTGQNPCFFDASWLTDICTSDDSYGYEESSGWFNPCFILQLEKTRDWKPAYAEGIPPSLSNHYDPGFVPVLCYIEQNLNSGNSSVSISVYPPKGFSHLFFPVSRFDAETYLSPLVAVKVNGIQKGETVSVSCSVITPNAFHLWNNGKTVITFVS